MNMKRTTKLIMSIIAGFFLYPPIHEGFHILAILSSGGQIFEVGYNYTIHNVFSELVNLSPILFFPLVWLLLYLGSKRNKKPTYESTLIYGWWLGEMVNYVSAFNIQSDYYSIWKYSKLIYLLILFINIITTIYLLYKNI